MRKTLIALLIAATLLLEVVVVYQYITVREHYIFDFIQPWTSARMLLFEGKNPYGPEVTREVQMALVGRELAPEVCQHTLLYPPFFAFIIPHFLLPYRLGLSVWIVTLQLLLIASVWLIVRCTIRSNRIGSAHLLLLTLAALTCRYSLLNLEYAQYSILILFWMVVTWWLWDRNQFILAGIALSQAAFKPQLTLLIIPAWLLLAVAQRHWRFVASFGAAMGLLLALPFLFVGNWVPDYLNTLEQAVRLCQTPVYAGANTVGKVSISLIVAGGVFALTLLFSRRWQGWLLGTLLSLGVLATLLGTPYLHSYDLVIALLPLVYGIVVLRGLRGKGARLVEAAFWSALLILPWLLRALVPSHDLESLERWLFPSVVMGLLVGLGIMGTKQDQAEE